MLLRCRPPIIPSATTAESSDSIAPSAAMANAGPASSRMAASDTGGRAGPGSAAEISPKRLPMVSTGQPRRWVMAVPAISATKGEGMRWLTRGHRRTISSVKALSATACGLTVSACVEIRPDPLDEVRGRMVQPEAERVAELCTAMMRAIAAVNPVTTGKRNELDRRCPGGRGRAR